MAFDALLKRFFPAVVLLMIAMAAYFQASGITELVAGAFLGTPPVEKVAKTPVRPTAAAAADTRGPKTAEPILSRNPFDSVTGPLNRVVTEATEGGGSETSQQADLSNPLAAPDCGGITAHVITESTDPTWSIAVLQAPGEQLGKMRRVGDGVGDKQVAYIGYNTTKNSPSVWLVGASALCQVLLFAPPQPPATQPTADATKTPTTAAASGSMKDISEKIQKVSDTEFHIDRSAVDYVLEHQAEMMKQTRIVPEQKDGKVVGVRLFGIRPDTLLGKLGLQNGDRLEAINGFEMASPEKALEAYAKLRTAESLNVKVTRRGAPVSIDFKIQ
jgi:general secretion pathway protein C